MKSILSPITALVNKKNKASKMGSPNTYDILGIEEVKGNVVRTNEKYILLLEAMPINFKLKSQNEQSIILSNYCDLLKIIQCSFGITTIVKKADLNEHLAYMEKFALTARSEEHKQRVYEYTNFVREQAGRSAVSRRFILDFEYPFYGDATINNTYWSDVINWAANLESQVRNMLLKSGVVLKEYINQAEQEYFVAEVFYEICNKAQAEKQRLRG